MIHLLDSNEKIIDVLANPSDGKVYWDSKITEDITSNLLTLDFTTLGDISFDDVIKVTAQDQDGDHRLFVISNPQKTHDGNGLVQVIAGDGDQILLGKAQPIKPQTLTAATVGSAGVFILANTNYSLGRVDDELGTQDVVFSDYISPLAALQQIATAFGAVLKFRVEINGNAITRYVDILAPDLETFSGKELVFGKDILGLIRSEDRNQIVTRMVGYAKDTNGHIVTFEDVNKGLDYVEDINAYQRWAINGEHLYGEYQYQSDSQDGSIDKTKMLAATQDALNQSNDAVVTYQVTGAALEQIPGYEHEKIRVYMNVRIKDLSFDPELYLTAQVQHTEMPELDDPNGNYAYQFGNFNEIQISTSAQIKQLQSQLYSTVSQARSYTMEYSAPDGLDFSDGSDSKRIIVYVYLGKEDVTNTLDPSQFVWEKINSDGTYDLDWESTYKDVGNIIIVGSEVVGCVIRCTIVDAQGFPSIEIYFKDGMNTVVGELANVQTDNTMSVLFITDSHYATGSKNGNNLKSRSTSHMRNAAYLTDRVKIDVAVHGGDLVDGDEPKSMQLSDFYDAATALATSINAPLLFLKGNHDDNSWYAHDNDGNLMRSVLQPAETYAIYSQYMDTNIVQDSGNEDLMYYYKDFSTQKIRIVVLNSFDNPYIMNADGTNEYPSQYTMAFGNSQLNWLANTALKLPDNTWGVLIFTHGPLQGTFSTQAQINSDLMYGILSAFTGGTTYSGSGTTTDYEASVSCDFTTQGAGEVIAVISGHVHYDSSQTKNGMLLIQTLDSLARNDFAGDMPDRPLSTLQEDAWDIFTIDRTNRKIHATRFGAGNSREFTY